MLGFEIILSGPFQRSDLTVTYNPAQSEARSDEANALIQMTWEAHARECNKLALPVFDGLLFRLNSHNCKGNRILLDLGDTTFREYIGTSIPTFFVRYPNGWVADPLAVCIALVTDDERIIIEKRTSVTRYRAPFHVIGGFMEREKDFFESRPDPFSAITREVEEELGIFIGPEKPTALGIVRNLRIRHPEMVFYCRLRESFDDIKRLLATGITDNEIEQLALVKDTQESLASFLIGHHSDITPSGEACLLLYGKQRHGETWYGNVLAELEVR